VRARFDFDSGDGQPPVLFRSPVRMIVARTVAEVRPAMAQVVAGLRDGLYAAGYVAYEAAPAFDDALVTQVPSSLPLLCFGLFRSPQRAPALADTAPPPAFAAFAMALRFASSSSNAAIARECASTSPHETRTPELRSFITSGMPPTSNATLGTPKNMHSNIVRQKLSDSDVNTPTSAT
jgi:hypothetical protein